MDNENLQQALLLLKKANIVLPKSAMVNIYHHYGEERFNETGAVFINIVNCDYCKSYVVMLPRQKYPCHYHKIKTESFFVLHGELLVEINGVTHQLGPGEMIHIERGQDHSFETVSGAIFEEISTTYIQNDSLYLDTDIQMTPYIKRRTTINSKEWEKIYTKWIM